MSHTQNQPSSSSLHRAVIVTALPVEYAAVRAHLIELHDNEHPQGDIYEEGIFNSEASTWHVGIVEIGAGNPGAAQKTERAIAHLHPEIVLFVGVAGGIKDVVIGDVVVATKVYGYHSGKAEAEFRTRPEVGLPTHRMAERARAEARKSDWLKRLSEPPKRRPRVLLGPIAAGEQVVASTEAATYRLIRASYGDALAVEMESYGFLRATHAYSNLEALVVRGISDLIEGKAEADASGSQEIASQHAAAFAFELLAKLGPSGPRPMENREDVREVQVQQPPTTAPTISQLRPPVADFVGREHEIEALIEALNPTEQTGATVILRGMGGTGKTELAYAVAQRLTNTFPDGQLFLELRGASDAPLSAEQALQRTTQIFDIQTQIAGELDQLEKRYRSELHRKQVLILADDARDADQVRRLTPPAGCALVITTRERFTFPGASVFDLHTLSEDAAAALVLGICPRIGEAARRLARLCGLLPLALRVSANALFNDATKEVEAYLKALTDERTRLMQMYDPNDRSLDVTAALRLSYAALGETAQTALRHISVFASSFDLEAAKAVVDLGKIKKQSAKEMNGQKQKGRRVPPGVHEVLSELYLRSLVDYDTATHRYSLHELVRIFGAQEMTSSERGRFRRYAIYYSGIAILAEGLYQTGGEQTMQALARFDRERVHIDTALNWLRRNQDDDLLLIYAQMIGEIGSLRYHPRHEMIPLGEELLEAARRRNRRDLQAVILNLLGGAYSNLGENRQAASFFAEALTLIRALRGRKRQRSFEAGLLNNLALCYRDLGEVRRAIELHKQSLAIQSELGNRRLEATSLHNLGLCYDDLGEVQRAIELHEQSLAIARKLGDRRGEASVLNGLGSSYADLGDVRRAIELHQHSLAIARKLGDRRGETICLGNLGLCYAYQSDPVRAIEQGEEALRIIQDLEAKRREGYALRCLGVAYATAGKIEEARELQRRAITIASVREDPRLKRMALNHLGEIYLQQGDIQRAVEQFEEAFIIAQKIGDRQYQAISSWNLGEARAQQGNLARAAELMQVRVDFEREVGHAMLDKHSQELARVREQLQKSEFSPISLGEPS